MQPERAEGRIKAVVFDYGKVVGLPQEYSDVKGMADFCGLSVEDFENIYWPPRLAYDRADLSGEEFWSPFLNKNGRIANPADIQKLVELDSEGWSRPNVAVLEWIRQLRDAGFTLAILSNIPLETRDYLMAHREWMQIFHSRVFSCDVRSVKPEPEIYEALLDMLKLPPHEILFLDDRPENVEGAKKFNIRALVFDDLERTLRRIRERFDLPVPGRQAAAREV